MFKRIERILEHLNSSVNGNKGYHGTSTIVEYIESALCLCSD
jgi:hypothetical protein